VRPNPAAAAPSPPLDLDLSRIGAKFDKLRLRRSRRILGFYTAFGVALLATAVWISRSAPGNWVGVATIGIAGVVVTAVCAIIYARLPRVAERLRADAEAVETRTLGGRTFRDSWSNPSLRLVVVRWPTSPAARPRGLEEVEFVFQPHPRVCAVVDYAALQSLRGLAVEHHVPISDWTHEPGSAYARMVMGSSGPAPASSGSNRTRSDTG